jgi:hypothetical protein
MGTGLSKQERDAGLRLVRGSDRIDRRAFLRTLGGSAAAAMVGGAAVTTLGACGGGGDGGLVTPPRTYGRIEGTVTDVGGKPQPSLGRIFLMNPDGSMSGRMVDVDPAGAFAFDQVAPGAWQLRFHAPRVAHVAGAEDGWATGAENPERITVEANRTATVRFPVVRSALDAMEIEIYIGDDFFYEVPFGAEGGTSTVKVGSSVCWYNVGQRLHNVTGPASAWGSSGDLVKGGNFIWTADQVGTFPYRCTHHEPNMRATLVVTA